MHFEETSPVTVGAFRLGKSMLFEENVLTAQRRYPDRSARYFAEFLLEEGQDFSTLSEAINNCVESRWGDPVVDLAMSPLRIDGKERHMYPCDKYFRATTTLSSPPSLYLLDDTILPMNSPRNPAFYPGVPVATQVTPVSYETEEEEKRVFLRLDGIRIMADDRKAYPQLALKRRRTATSLEGFKV